MRTIFFIPTRDDTCVRTEGGTVEMYFATVEDLKIALWRALIYPAAHKCQLNDLENGFRVSIAVTEAQWKAFYASIGDVTPRCPVLILGAKVNRSSMKSVARLSLITRR